MKWYFKKYEEKLRGKTYILRSNSEFKQQQNKKTIDNWYRSLIANFSLLYKEKTTQKTYIQMPKLARFQATKIIKKINWYG